MLLDRSNWARHRPWFVVSLLATLAAAGWYTYAAITSPHRPGGSSLPGFLFGIVGGLLCLFEFAFWLRKKVRAWRLGSAQSWLRAHIWLGLLTLPLLVLHSGFRFGGVLSTILLLLLIVVVASGVWGWALQNILPGRLLAEVPLENVVYQRDALGAQLDDDARSMVAKVCGIAPVAGDKDTKSEAEEDEGASVTVAVARPAVQVPSGLADCQALATFFETALSPYLKRGSAGFALLEEAGRSRLLFDNVRAQVPPEAHIVVAVLESYCHQRRQWDRQARIHFWLHSWLWVHFPLSVALIVLMFVHVVVALKYY